MWIIAIIAMLCWSGSDIFSKIGSKQDDKLSHYKVGIAVGLVMGIHALYEIAVRGVPFAFSDIITYLPASAFYIISMVVGYVGLRYIELSISSPICNGSGAVTAILCMLTFGVCFSTNSGEAYVKGPLSNVISLVYTKLFNTQFSPEENAVFLNIPIIAGIAMIMVGIIALGIIDNTENPDLRAQRQLKANRKYAKSFLAILLPVLYCILDSCGTFVDTLIADNYVAGLIASGLSEDAADTRAGDVLNVAYELTWFLVAVVFSIYVFIFKKEKISKGNGKFELSKLAGGICETIGQVFYMMVIVAGYVPGYVIISAYCAVSLVWGSIFLKEKLSWKHYIALILAFAGILILGFYDV